MHNEQFILQIDAYIHIFVYFSLLFVENCWLLLSSFNVLNLTGRNISGPTFNPLNKNATFVDLFKIQI